MPELLGDEEPMLGVGDDDRPLEPLAVAHASHRRLQHRLGPHEGQQLLRISFSRQRPEAAPCAPDRMTGTTLVISVDLWCVRACFRKSHERFCATRAGTRSDEGTSRMRQNRSMRAAADPEKGARLPFTRSEPAKPPALAAMPGAGGSREAAAAEPSRDQPVRTSGIGSEVSRPGVALAGLVGSRLQPARYPGIPVDGTMLLINDLDRHGRQIDDLVRKAIDQVLSTGSYILGRQCSAFESEFAAYCQADHCVAVANGTDALEIALRCLGVERGSRVATVANAGFYTSTALAPLGAEPVFVDTDPIDHLMDVQQLAAVLDQSKVDCIVVTHLYGLMHDMRAIAALAAARGIPVLEDCAQAHGATRGGRRAGSFGQAAVFSFYPTKNLGAIGDGGAIVTSDATVAERARRLRQYGWGLKYRVTSEGGRNSRLDEIQAAVLRAKLPHLPEWNRRRRDIARRYSTEIKSPRVKAAPVRGEEYVAHLYVVRCDDRDGLRKHLAEAGIASDIHYPVPDHCQPVLAGRDWPRLPVTEQGSREILTVPCFPELTDAEVEHVIARINAW